MTTITVLLSAREYAELARLTSGPITVSISAERNGAYRRVRTLQLTESIAIELLGPGLEAGKIIAD